MTHIKFFKSGDIFYGFTEEGHAGYGEAGTDILCSALSAMTMLIINAVEVSYASDVDYQIDDKSATIRLIARGALPKYEKDEKKRYAVAGLIMAYYYQLNDLTEEYYDYLTVDVEEKELEEEPPKK